MTILLRKPVKRKTEETRRDRGKFRPYIITLFPGGLIGFRLQGTRTTEHLPVAYAYEQAVRLRVAKEHHDKKMARKAKREGRY